MLCKHAVVNTLLFTVAAKELLARGKLCVCGRSLENENDRTSTDGTWVLDGIDYCMHRDSQDPRSRPVDLLVYQVHLVHLTHLTSSRRSSLRALQEISIN